MIATRRQSGERGYVLVTMTVAAVAMLGALGMAVDMGKLYITKSETQAFCDAASVAAALKLNGAASGITNAIAAVSATTNTWNFNTSTVSSPTVEFSILSTGPWVANPSPATGYIYARVKTAVTPSTFFVPVILKNFGQTVTYTQTVNSMAIAGQVPITSFPKGLAPYTVVSTNTVGPDFGLTKGVAYDMQWPQYNGTKNGCVPSDPTSDASNCFQNGSPPCAGDLASQTTMHAVAQ